MRRAARLELATAGALVAIATMVTGTLLRSGGTVLGVPTPPFLAPIHLQAHPLALVAAAVLAAAVWLAPRTLRLPAPAFAAISLIATSAIRLAVNAGRYGTGEWDRVFDLERSFEAKNEYLPALNALQYGPGFLLDRFAELIPSLPPHAAAHPPGGLLLLDGLGVSTSASMAALCIGAGVLATPVAYATARVVLQERAARIATLLLVLSPDAVLFGATSADAVFLLLGMLAAWPLALWAVRGSRPGLALGAVAVVAGTFFAWSLPAIAAWAAVLARRRAVGLVMACAAATGLLHLGLYAATGYDVIGALRGTEDLYRFSVASKRPYLYWLFGSPVAFLVVLGLPIAWLFLRAVSQRRETAVALAVVLAVATLLGFTKAETERIWLFFVPLACIAAAPLLPERRLRLVLGLLALQGLAIELTFDTVW